MDRFDCYEYCVQSPRHLVSFLYGAHGGEPLVLAEDFCGNAAVAARWAAEGVRRGDAARAVAIDLDPEAVARAVERAGREGVPGRVHVIRGDALDPPGEPGGADVIFIGNFSIGYIHERRGLVHYFHRCRERLARGAAGRGGGILACDTYGGAGAFRLGGFTRRHPGRAGETIHYTWLHERADPITAMVENSISFRVELDGEIIQELPRAFVYRWRLWSIAELREAMFEAGFRGVEVYADVNTAPGHRPAPVADPSELAEDWIVLIVGRA